MAISQEIGASIPNNTPHAVSVTLPTWEATVAYEEGQDWVVGKMNSGYPRFFIHTLIQKLAAFVENGYGREGERVMVFPSYKTARKCREFIKQHSELANCPVRILQLTTPAPKDENEASSKTESTIGVVFFPASEFPVAKQFWQHSGMGISSRMGEYVLSELETSDKNRKKLHPPTQSDAPTRTHYSKPPSILKQELQQQKLQRRSNSSSERAFSTASSGGEPEKEYSTYIEERFGRNLDLSFSKEAKIALKRRISGKIGDATDTAFADENRGKYLHEDDVYLYPSGMASIFSAHQALLGALPPNKSVCFGFPYVDTLNILKKFGPGCHYYGFGDDASLDELEKKLEEGLEIMGLFCECPSNPLLKTPDLKRIRGLADKFGFAIVVDETVGNFLNIHVLPFADIVVSSLTKVFSGDSNVMAGSLVLNPNGPLYDSLKAYFDKEYEDLFWAEDALYLERNSRDFAIRSKRVNVNATAAVELLKSSPLIGDLFYPSQVYSKKYYDALKTPEGGYGGLISFVFKDPADARCFFNEVALSKGPSLGTNFTLACPYSILAHFQELDEIEKWGVDRNLIRISVGLEDKGELISTLQSGLDAAAAQHE